MIRRILASSVLALTSFSPTADAQYYFLPPVRGSFGFSVAGQVAQPVGEFKTQVDAAWGVGFTGRFITNRGIGIRSDFTFLNYGYETKRVPLSPTVNRVMVDMRTSNNIAIVSIGPEIILGSGPVQPYAHAFVGYSYFYTQSSVGGDNEDWAFASSTNFDDGGLASGYGGGFRIPISGRRTHASIDIGGRLTSAGDRSYLKRGDIVDQPDGSLAFTPRTTATDFWQYHIGVSLSSRPSRR